MKISSISLSCENINNPYGLLDLDDNTKDEIDLIIEMGHELLAHQEGKFDFDDLKEKLIELAQIFWWAQIWNHI